MRLFLAISYDHRVALAPVIERVKKVLQEKGWSVVVFVERNQEGMTAICLMEEALHELATCDALLAEMSYKTAGVGIEMGYMKALGKPIIGLRKKGSEPSMTMEGVLTYPVEEYDDLKDIHDAIALLVGKILSS